MSKPPFGRTGTPARRRPRRRPRLRPSTSRPALRLGQGREDLVGRRSTRTPTLCRMSTISITLLFFCSSIASAIRLIRCSRASQADPDLGELGDGARQLGLVDPVAPLAPGGRGVHQSDPVQHHEVLRDGLPGHRQLLAQRVAVPAPSASSRSSIRRRVGSPTADHRSSSTGGQGGALGARSARSRPGCGQEVRPARHVLAVLLLEDRDLPALLTEPGLGQPQQRSRRRTARARRSPAASCRRRSASPSGWPSGSGTVRRLHVDHRERRDRSPRRRGRRRRRSHPVRARRRRSKSASSGHHSRTCSGLLITSKTTSGEASTWISRSMVPSSTVATSRLLPQPLVADDSSADVR